jgi:geranylgeranyl pyrophosphate synthase
MGTATLPTRGRYGSQDMALKAFTAEYAVRMEGAIGESIAGFALPATVLERALADAVDVGGGQAHRWRPLVVLAAAHAAGADPEEAMQVAAATELTHTASLILDDLPCMDNAPLRRGRPSTHQQVGDAGAILLAVGLLGRAVELIGQAPRETGPLSEEWGAAVGLHGMSGGQAMDLRQRAGDALRGDGRRLYRRKTTALAAFAARAGGHLAGAGTATLSALHQFGEQLGWAYQLRDDDADVEEDGAGSRLLAMEQAGMRRARLVRRAERALEGVPWRNAASAEVLAAAARRIAGVPAASLKER